jgi:hypothetical protein
MTGVNFMFGIKSSAGILLLSIIFNGSGAAACDAQENPRRPQQNMNNQQRRDESKNPQPSSTPQGATTVNGITVLAQGSHSAVEASFAAVVRDRETYNALRELETELPERNEEFFRTNVVIAAFAGTRNTGGYSVRIARTGNSTFRVVETAPARGQIRTQVITTPFQIASVPATPEQSIRLELGERFRNAMRTYRVTSGRFTMSGGIAGRVEEFRIGGVMRVMHSGRLATVIFDLSATGATRPRYLQTIATGITQPRNINIARLDAGTLVDSPHTGLRAVGRYTNEINNLSVTFSSLPSNIADGFTGQGNLEAQAVPVNQPR